jgi:hypothetical protein
VSKYHIHATDGDIGHAQGLLIDEANWAIRFIFVETGNWWLGHHVLVAPNWIERVSYERSSIYMNLTRGQLSGAPPYEADAPLPREPDVWICDRSASHTAH